MLTHDLRSTSCVSLPRTVTLKEVTQRSRNSREIIHSGGGHVESLVTEPSWKAQHQLWWLCLLGVVMFRSGGSAVLATAFSQPTLPWFLPIF